LLVLLVFVVFGGALRAPFHFDDYSFFNAPPVGVDGPLGAGLVFEQTRPLTWLTYWLNWQADPRPWGFHLVNLLLHAAASVLAWRLLRQWLPENAARIAALIFALHPLQTEAVVYVFARATLLAALLCLAALLLWTRGRGWLAAGVFALALLAKEEVAAFPAFLFLAEVSQGQARRRLRPILAMAALALAAGLRTVAVTSAVEGSGAGAQAGITSFEYFSVQGLAILRYLWLLLAPLNLTVDVDLRPESPLLCSLAWGVIAVLPILALRGFTRFREGFWLIAGLVLLLPSSSIFPAADVAADRRMYFPLFCFAALAGRLLIGARPWMLYAALATGGVLSYAQTRVWQSEQALWMEAARQAPDKVRPKRQLARQMAPAQAVEILEEALRQAPDDADVHTDLGQAHLRAGRAGDALAAFGRALALRPNDARALNNRGAALAGLGQHAAAQADWRRALAADPCHFDAWINLRRAGQAVPDAAGCRWAARQRALISEK
jgi:tetratricopeptide (TPR) repeat protein